MNIGAGTSERVPAAQLVAVQLDNDVALFQRLIDRYLGAVSLGAVAICARVPHDHRSCPVLTLWNDPLEVGVVDRVVLDPDREPFFHAGHSKAP
jgi:hypothetical protein